MILLAVFQGIVSKFCFSYLVSVYIPPEIIRKSEFFQMISGGVQVNEFA